MVKAVVIDDFTKTRKEIDALCDEVFVSTANKTYWFKIDENGEIVGGIAKFLQEKKDEVKEALNLKPGDFVALSAGKKLAAQKTAGVIRKIFGNSVDHCIDRERYEFCWIVDFPM